MSVIEAVLFDADGVIQSTSSGWRTELAALCGDASRTEAFLEDLFAAERPCLTGEREFAHALAEVLDRWESRATVEDALRIWTLIEPQDELLAIVESLGTIQVRTGLATNQQPLRARYMEEDLKYGERFDELLFSCRIGHAKPDPRYFDGVLEVLELEGNRVLFIDDHPANVEAARDRGLRAEVYDQVTGVTGMLELLTAHGLEVEGI